MCVFCIIKTMEQLEREKAIRGFIEDWRDRGDEKQHSQKFWIDLLEKVVGAVNATKVIDFEERVKIGATKYIDGYIAETKTIIEQKGSKIDLDRAEKQSDGTELTPFEQAKRYNDNLPYEKKARWIVVSNFQEFRIHDMNREEPEKDFTTIKFTELDKQSSAFKFLIDEKIERIRLEEDLSVKAGKLVGKLYDALFPQYINPNASSLKSLNILCVRIVFCFYAEKSGLFESRTAFEDYLMLFNLLSMRDALIKLFYALDTTPDKRDKYDTATKSFPYVDGGLFQDKNIEIPNFTQEIVDVLINHCAVFNWAEISPTIFGAVFESTLNPETRKEGGMHYTSIENIHKVIAPLFLNELSAEFDEICSIAAKKMRNAKLLAFQKKLGSFTFLDPACGSGNFLTETYLSLRRLENKCIKLRLGSQQTALDVLGDDFEPQVKIENFYGIEINDFAVTVAKTAMWIAECQMAEETAEILGKELSFLPLKTAANIVEGNALKIDWRTLKPIDETDLTEGLFAGFATELDGKVIDYDFIIGNPPFIGKKEQKDKKNELLSLFPKTLKGTGILDYVTGWYVKAIETIKDTNIKCAFVSTNSITQGEQVPILWRYLLQKGLKINFAWRTFKWENETPEKKLMAAVHCVVIGFSVNDEKEKYIFNNDGSYEKVKHINGYLLACQDIFIERRANPICAVEKIGYGNMPIDDNHLILTKEEAKAIIDENKNNKKFVKRYAGGVELLQKKERYCLWLKDATITEMRKSKLITERIKATQAYRRSSEREDTVKLADTPWLFGWYAKSSKNMLVIPKVSSERRKYIPIVFLCDDIIINGSALIIPDASLYDFGILTSIVHNAWMRTVAGRMKSDYQYSGSIVYNNFPWCSPTAEQKLAIENTAQAILDARSNHSADSLADLYDETFMPSDLRKAHRANDCAVMEAYGFNEKMSEADIVAKLFALYEGLTK